MTSLLKKYENARKRGITREQFSEHLGMTDAAFRSKIYRIRKSLKPENFQVDIGNPLEITSDEVVITGDVHVPQTSLELVSLLSQVAEKQLSDKRILIVAGDLLSLDVLSSYTDIVNQPTFVEEVTATQNLLQTWCETFSHIYILMGNHERRMNTWIKGDSTSMWDFLFHGDKVTFSNFGWCWLNTSTGRYRITHSSQYSINQLTVANELAQKFQTHIITHHEHHLAMGWDRYKRYLIINNGMLGDQSKMAYTQMDDNKSPMMAQGFVLFRNGFPYVLGKSPFTNWSDWI